MKHDSGFVVCAGIPSIASPPECSIRFLAKATCPAQRNDFYQGAHNNKVQSYGSTTSNGWLPGVAVPEVEQLKKRKYHLTKWPHSGLADQLIESIGGNPDSIQYKSDLLTSFGALPRTAAIATR